MRNVSFGVTSRASKEHCLVAPNCMCLTREETSSINTVTCVGKWSPAWKSCLCARPSHPEMLEATAAWRHQQVGDPLPGQCCIKPREEDGEGLPQSQQANAFGSILFSPSNFVQMLSGLVGITSWWAPRKHFLKKEGGSGGNALAVCPHYVFSTPETLCWVLDGGQLPVHPWSILPYTLEGNGRWKSVVTRILWMGSGRLSWTGALLS